MVEDSIFHPAPLGEAFVIAKSRLQHHSLSKARHRSYLCNHTRSYHWSSTACKWAAVCLIF